MTAVETTKEKWHEAEVNRVVGEIALMSPEPIAANAEAYFERASQSPPTTSKSLGNCVRGDEHGAGLA